MIQFELFSKIQEQISQDTSASGIMLMGSVAQNIATPESDLDIMILCNENYFKSEIVDEILVECIYTTYDNRMQKLMDNEMEVYHFINNKITYDKYGQLHDLMEIAVDKYNNFITKQETKMQIYHWLYSTRLKLLSAISSKDTLRQNYIVSTNSWKIIEAIWAINNEPVPPSSSVLRFYNTLETIPYSGWFETLFSSDDNSKVNRTLDLIEWILSHLNCTL
ncbi:nucleotidyltransferase domain-containing protein [Anaeromicropila herbilytica]|uniref:DNA polymerase subunit beta n=1 Tax=Anaeromicropila herbilytica TaxID=2785025 RepID=A0A7R7ELF4_9FIRM|nr:nucleotidyltransferase domain-containing protein [Anaeromicropila herbilytica]BCN30913.1 DNA polymerase subunit beta [Anaeromicropila herbilytica]